MMHCKTGAASFSATPSSWSNILNDAVAIRFARTGSERAVADMVIVYWKDIPAQVKSGSGRNTVRKELSPRFAEAIDRAAMRSGEKDSDAYLAQWRTSAPRSVEGTAEEAVASLVVELEAAWTDARLAAAVASGGRDG